MALSKGFGANLKRFLPASVIVNKAITVGSNSKITHSISLSGKCSCSYHRQTAPTTFASWLSSHRSFLSLNTCSDSPVPL